MGEGFRLRFILHPFAFILSHNLFVFWLWEIPLAYALAYTFGLGPHGVFVAVAVAFSTLAIASALVFRRGRWKSREV